jgi:hypothetical protein
MLSSRDREDLFDDLEDGNHRTTRDFANDMEKLEVAIKARAGAQAVTGAGDQVTRSSLAGRRPDRSMRSESQRNLELGQERSDRHVASRHDRRDSGIGD